MEAEGEAPGGTARTTADAAAARARKFLDLGSLRAFSRAQTAEIRNYSVVASSATAWLSCSRLRTPKRR